MAGVVGTVGMLAEASGTGAEMGAWVTCFPGYGMLTADRPGVLPPAAPAPWSPTSAAGPAGPMTVCVGYAEEVAHYRLPIRANESSHSRPAFDGSSA
jgi:hypothetical protein